MGMFIRDFIGTTIGIHSPIPLNPKASTLLSTMEKSVSLIRALSSLWLSTG